MANIHVDFEEGNNNYSGSSFDLLASGTDGRISSSTFSSTSANFPDDGSLIGHYLSIFNGTSYVSYVITAWVSSTSLTIAGFANNSLANQSVDRQYYIGGRWLDLTNLAATSAVRYDIGDTVKIKASPTPTSLDINTTWTSSVARSTISIVSSTNASPISITANNHGYSSGDTVVIAGHTTNTNANGTWEITVTGTNTFTLNNSTGNGVGGATGTVRLINNSVVRLQSALTANIASYGNVGEGRTAWTASANATATLDTAAFKESNCSDNFSVTAAFTSGVVAYKTLPSAIDLSSYQQISFWLRQSAGTVATSGDLSLRLCSDPSGVTVVDTFSIESPMVLNQWFPVTINKGSPLGSGIQSISLNLANDRGAQTFLINNIIACKPASSGDSISLQSLIGKNTTNEPWCTIQSINGTRLIIDQNSTITAASTNNRGYYGTSETVTGYKRETIKPTMLTTSTATVTTLANINSIISRDVVVEGGYDRTNMNSRVDYTFFDGRNNLGRFLSILLRGNYSFKYLGLVRYDRAINYQIGGGLQSTISISNMQTISNNIGISFDNATVNSSVSDILSYFDNIAIGIFNGNSFLNISNIYGGCSTTSTSVGGGAADNGFVRINGASNIIFDNITTFNNTNAIYILACYKSLIKNSNFSYNSYGLLNVTAVDTEFKNCTFSNNIIASVRQPSIISGLVFNKCIFSDSVEFEITPAVHELVVYSQNHDNTLNYHYIQYGHGIISTVTDITKNGSGISWRFAPNTNANSSYPLRLDLAKVAVLANNLVTVKAWMRRSNSSLGLGLRVKADQIEGVTSNITSFMSAVADTWEEVILTFTPTENGVVNIEGLCTGGNTHFGYIDDISITQ